MDSITATAETLSRAELIIFDWDGTLVDSRRVIVDTLRAAMDEAGFEPLPPGECQQVIGLGLDEAIRHLLPHADETGWAAMRDSYGRRFQQFGAADMPFFPGAAEGLSRLRGQGRRLAVATGKSRRGLDRVLAEMGLAEAFHATRCADETASKPDPRMLRELLGELGLAPAQAVFVGDTAFDMEMAHRLDMPRIAVTYGVHGRDRLGLWAPTAWADDFNEVLELVAGPALDRAPVEGYN